MKKFLAGIITLAMLLSMAACGNSKGNNAEQSTVSQSSASSQQSETTESTTKSTTTSTTASKAKATVDWREFLDEYEEWVDSYIALLNKYKANPSDASLITDYYKMASQAAEWSSKADKVKTELTDSSELAEYSARLLKISEKITKAAYTY